MITNCKLIHHGKNFQNWSCERDGIEYGYIANTSMNGGGYGPGGVKYHPYTRIFKMDDNKFDYKPVPNIAEFNKFMPLDLDNPIPGIEKFYKLMLLV